MDVIAEASLRASLPEAALGNLATNGFLIHTWNPLTASLNALSRCRVPMMTFTSRQLTTSLLISGYIVSKRIPSSSRFTFEGSRLKEGPGVTRLRLSRPTERNDASNRWKSLYGLDYVSVGGS